MNIVLDERESFGEANSENVRLSTGTDRNWKAHLFIVIIILSCVLFSSPILLYPQHNSIQFQEYWYESIIYGGGVTLTLSLDSLIALKYYFREDSMVSFAIFIQLYIASVTTWSITCTLVYLSWSVLLGYNHPMPLTLAVGCITFLVQYITLNILFYRKGSLSAKAKKTIRSFNISRVWALFIELQFKGLSFLFTLISSDYQWILAFVIPLMREFNFQIMHGIMIKSPKIEDGKAQVIIGMNAFNALYVAIKLGNTTTQVTSICILSIDFVLNIYSCLQIINLHRAIATDIPSITRKLKERDYLLSKLILIEMIEVLVPLSYVVTVLVAYYGPNAEILGNIRNDYWQYESIDDIGKLVQAVLVMFTIDGCSAMIVGCMLWKVCSIHFIRETCKIIENCWPIIAVNIANYLNYVSLHAQYYNISLNAK